MTVSGRRWVDGASMSLLRPHPATQAVWTRLAERAGRVRILEPDLRRRWSGVFAASHQLAHEAVSLVLDGRQGAGGPMASRAGTRARYRRAS